MVNVVCRLRIISSQNIIEFSIKGELVSKSVGRFINQL